VAFDEGLAERVRGLVRDDPDASERKMFGGLCFMTNGNMCVGIVSNELRSVSALTRGPRLWRSRTRRRWT
jgi:hypothetical protein